MIPQVAVLTTGLVAVLLVLQPLSDHTADMLREAEQVASIGQVYQLELSLELYYLEYGAYPRVADAELTQVLYEAGMLKQAVVPGEVEYASDGHTYELSLH